LEIVASLGTYGVVSYTVVRRRRGLRTRMVLGADPSRVLRLVLREAGRSVAILAVISTLITLRMVQPGTAIGSRTTCSCPRRSATRHLRPHDQV